MNTQKSNQKQYMGNGNSSKAKATSEVHFFNFPSIQSINNSHLQEQTL